MRPVALALVLLLVAPTVAACTGSGATVMGWVVRDGTEVVRRLPTESVAFCTCAPPRPLFDGRYLVSEGVFEDLVTGDRIDVPENAPSLVDGSVYWMDGNTVHRRGLGSGESTYDVGPMVLAGGVAHTMRDGRLDAFDAMTGTWIAQDVPWSTDDAVLAVSLQWVVSRSDGGFHAIHATSRSTGERIQLVAGSDFASVADMDTALVRLYVSNGSLSGAGCGRQLLTFDLATGRTATWNDTAGPYTLELEGYGPSGGGSAGEWMSLALVVFVVTVASYFVVRVARRFTRRP